MIKEFFVNLLDLVKEFLTGAKIVSSIFLVAFVVLFPVFYLGVHGNHLITGTLISLALVFIALAAFRTVIDRKNRLF